MKLAWRRRKSTRNRKSSSKPSRSSENSFRPRTKRLWRARANKFLVQRRFRFLKQMGGKHLKIRAITMSYSQIIRKMWSRSCPQPWTWWTWFLSSPAPWRGLGSRSKMRGFRSSRRSRSSRTWSKNSSRPPRRNRTSWRSTRIRWSYSRKGGGKISSIGRDPSWSISTNPWPWTWNEFFHFLLNFYFIYRFGFPFLFSFSPFL